MRGGTLQEKDTQSTALTGACGRSIVFSHRASRQDDATVKRDELVGCLRLERRGDEAFERPVMLDCRFGIDIPDVHRSEMRKGLHEHPSFWSGACDLHVLRPFRTKRCRQAADTTWSGSDHSRRFAAHREGACLGQRGSPGDRA